MLARFSSPNRFFFPFADFSSHVRVHVFTLKRLNFSGVFTKLPDMNDDPLTLLDDWEAARRAAEGDTSAFQPLYNKHSPALFKFLASRLGRGEAEDALNEVCMSVWRAMKNRYVENHFRGWIFQIARNQIIDRLRRRSRTETSPGNEETIPGTFTLPDLAMEIQQRQIDLRECLGVLPKEYSSVVTGYLSGEDHETIARNLGIPLGTSHSRLSKAKPLIKQCMERKGWAA